MARLPVVEPLPSIASLRLPWDAADEGPNDPVAALAQARARHGDTFVVDSGGTRYLFLFSPAGVRAFYAVPERQASKGLADCRMLLRKLPEELFAGRRTLAHDLFGNEEVEGYLEHLEQAISRQLDELGDAGTLEVFAWSRRLGHRLGLASWAGAESAAPPRLEALIADLDRLDGADAFVRPGDMAGVRAAGKRDERAALARVGGQLAEVLAERRRAGRRAGDFLEAIADRWVDVGETERTPGIAGDVVLLHLASMSNLFAALGWTIVHLLQHPAALARVVAGDDAFLHRAAQESIRLAQRSIMLRAVLAVVEVDDGTQTYRVEPDVVLATMLPLTNTSAAPGLERYDPARWVGRRLRNEAVLPAKELVATFGHGRHACPAQRFSLSAIVRAVRRLVDAYELDARFTTVHPYPESRADRRRGAGGGALPGRLPAPPRRGVDTLPRSGVEVPPMPGGTGFVEELRAMIDAGRAFGRHPLWRRIADGQLPRSALGPFAVQFFLQVREFPRAVSALHSTCPDIHERVELAESLYEEETGRISGCNVSHPELFIRFGEGVGVPRDEMVQGVPLPTTAALIDWFERSTREHPFIEGAAATNLAAEGQVPGTFGPFARALERHYGCTPAQVAFWDIHEQADREHSAIGDHVVVRLATTPALQADVQRAVARSLELWWAFFDGIATATRA